MEEEKIGNFTQSQIDALREVSNIGAGSAVTALSQFVGRPVKMEPTGEVIFNSTEDFRAIFGDVPMISVISSEIPDKISGHLLIIFEQENTMALAGLLLGAETVDGMAITNELAVSAIKEVGNVMFGAYAAAMGNMASMSVMIAPPSFDSGSPANVVDGLDVNRTIKDKNIAICFESSFWVEADTDIPGYMLFVPAPISLNVLLKILGMPGN